MVKTVQFQFRNDQNTSVELVIEPWALLETISENGVVTFEVNTSPAPEIEFSNAENGRPYVYVMSERVVIQVNGITKHEFKTDIRPPRDVFPALRKLLWPS